MTGDGTLRLRNARAPAALVDAGVAAGGRDDLVDVDILIANGRIASVEPAGGAATADGAGSGSGERDLDRGIVFPAFIDMHTHIDKGHIWPRARNADGGFASALDEVAADRTAHWSAADVRRRMDFSLRCAYAHGTAVLRTHIDSIPPQQRISWPVFAGVREAWAGRVELQGAALIAIDSLPEGRALDDFIGHVKAHGGIMGGVLYMVDGLDRELDRLLDSVGRADIDLDLHVDETVDPASVCLDRLAGAVARAGIDGRRITCGHCCSLVTQDEAVALATLDKVAGAGLAIVSLPMCNLYLQDRHAGRTPRLRGATLVHEMKARGIRAALASDNTRDPFYAYGDLDMLEVLREATRIQHLDHPVGEWPAAVTAVPAAIIGLGGRATIAAGSRADLVLFRARSWTELFARPQADREVLREGVAIAAELPDYRLLDDLEGFAV